MKWTQKAVTRGRRREPHENQIDWMVKENAILLADWIQEFWANRGGLVNTNFLQGGNRYYLRSDMRDGLPRRSEP